MLTDNVGLIGVGDFPESEGEEFATAVSVGALKEAVELLETLGYADVDLRLAGHDREGADHPLLMLRPTPGAIYADDNAAVTVCPKTEKGRQLEKPIGAGGDR